MREVSSSGRKPPALDIALSDKDNCQTVPLRISVYLNKICCLFFKVQSNFPFVLFVLCFSLSEV